ncbi:ribulose-5-phosphate 4-epimerase [Gluconobacter thailandicus F149-1 = NBRC 100600]|uniref:class II aldolase/adducin family protein n=1 Tax=Gluconobacter thailandicus TaxID=257438 RepID=UPI00054F93B4|nr:class II aldolase/adducin family protein [Gluconobacter thailandicus]KXV54385.1 ribulose phosphate epimerase [Gluconobacter thailandicus]GAN94318.1 ribulose-5-phosphate 4-epimerase [Gluconobacter thailandicus F149-1 = NBRC 100600]GBR60377.1 ribulose-5-phosphate 4-epimerase [Gluconobacter thailandicus F149-1 = NBRC 100600]GEL88291.1 class II aldolase [Gluconobacter thailandicus F149-1 = NBRC 100600]
MTMDTSTEEWCLRKRLAECYHLINYYGWTEMIFNHISLRLPGEPKRYLVNPFGLNYDEVTPENLLIVNADGQLVGESAHKPNPAGFALHGSIHTAREDIHCVIHTHTNAVCAVAMKQGGFSHDNFYGAQLFERVGYHDFEGITLYDEERPRMLESLGDRHVMVLRNHGIAVGEADVARTFFLLWIVQRAAEIQCHAGMIPGPDVLITDEIKRSCAKDAAALIAGSSAADKMFDAAVRKMRKERGPLWAGDTV